VIRLTDVEEGIVPPSVKTLGSSPGPDGRIVLRGEWSSPVKSEGAKVGFEYRDITGEDTRSRQQGWNPLGLQAATSPGGFTSTFEPQAGRSYEFRAVLQHPLATLYGEAIVMEARGK
jgi:alpha-L-fucosidase